LSLINDFRRSVHPGPLYEDDRASFSFGGSPIRVIAYYLPQFHPIPENDEWWGKGFTEWTNVTKSFPRFRGHYQPHLPGELGFYDLRNPEVLYRQAELARRYGLHGFCIHHYWFGGKTLLDEPLRILLEHKDIKIGFCLNWANENWTRAWDGGHSKILIAQRHSPEDDLALAVSLERSLADPRYIRIDGRPLLMIYRPSILPDARATADRWREHFERSGYGNPYLVISQADFAVNPSAFGMDAAAGFPPHVHGYSASRHILRHVLARLENRRYKGFVKSYDKMISNALASLDNFSSYQSSLYTLFPGVCPNWDNHARREFGAQAFVGSTPQKYGAWLQASCEFVLRQNASDKQIVFINAWNEWAEGAHLEPDRHFGYAYLAETGRVISALARQSSRSDLAYTSR
jgi:lipopolysaccharide biosynthesis protein